MKLIPLTQGKFSMVDDSDFDRLNQFKWYAVKDKKSWYAKTYVDGNVIPMHRMVLELNDNKIFPDHIDHNGLNNQRNNLRIATKYQNQVNRTATGRSKYLGVFINTSKYKDKTYIYWQSCIQKDGVKEHLGCFKKEEDAALAYNKRASELFGEFANLNII